MWRRSASALLRKLDEPPRGEVRLGVLDALLHQLIDLVVRQAVGRLHGHLRLRPLRCSFARHGEHAVLVHEERHVHLRELRRHRRDARRA